MNDAINICFQCKSEVGVVVMYGYSICESCKKKMGLFTDKKIEEYKKNDPSFKEDMIRRLGVVEKDYIKKKIKLLYILNKLKEE